MIRIKSDGKLIRLNASWWTPTKKDWVPSLLQSNKELWLAQMSPDGIPWKALSPAYSKWKVRHFGSLPILRLTGKMQDTSYIKVVGNTFKVVTTDEGVYNQFGTEKMPARPWMGLPQKSLSSLSQIALSHILK